MKELGPVSTYLAASFPSGKRDTETDMRKQAVNRIAEVNGHTFTVDNNLYTTLQPLMGHPSDAAFKIHQHVTAAVKYLAATAPKDPGLVIHMFGSDWVPSQQEALALAYRMEAVLSPMDAIRRSLANDGHPAAVEALWTVWPSLMTRAAEEMGNNAIELSHMTYEKAQGYSLTFRAPLSGLQGPAVMLTLQSLYLPPPSPPPRANGKQPTGNPTGRPPAVENSVAGSNVAKLIRG